MKVSLIHQPKVRSSLSEGPVVTIKQNKYAYDEGVQVSLENIDYLITELQKAKETLTKHKDFAEKMHATKLQQSEATNHEPANKQTRGVVLATNDISLSD